MPDQGLHVFPAWWAGSDAEVLGRIAAEEIGFDADGYLPEFLTTFRSYLGPAAERRLAGLPDWVAAP
jgi:hypothetical protein